jgi:hypothetical protein
MPHSLVVGTHDGHEITLGSDGQFAATIGEDTLTSRTLRSLHSAIDDHKRKTLRLSAESIPCVAFSIDTPWRSGQPDELIARWIYGSFQGINAHTGQVRIKVENGDIEECSSITLIRADHPDLPQLKRFAQHQIKAHAALEACEAATHKLLADIGYRSGRHYAGGKGKTEALAEETRILAYLQPESEAATELATQAGLSKARRIK